MYEFILASQSPRRQKLFGFVQTPFLVLPADVNEDKKPQEKPGEYVVRLAKMKAENVGEKVADIPSREVIIIAADTTVVDDGEILGKPVDAEEAKKILTRLRGKTHLVNSGLAVHKPSEDLTLIEKVETKVTLRNYDEEEIKAYIASGDPFDKAGAYAIQNDAFQPVHSYEGCYANVMGLPLCHLEILLAKMGAALSGDVPIQCQERFNYDCKIPDRLLQVQHL